MEKRDLEKKRMAAYEEALNAEKAFVTTRSLLAQIRYQSALNTLSKIEREWAQYGAIDVQGVQDQFEAARLRGLPRFRE